MSSRRVVITYPFPLGRATGGARMTREIARHLGRAGHRVRIVSVSSDLPSGTPRKPAAAEHLGFEFDEELARDQVTVHRVDPHPRHWLLDGLPVKAAVAELLRAEPADLVLSYHHEGAFLPGLVAKHGARRGIIATWQSYAEFLTGPVVPKLVRGLVNRRLILKPFRAADILFATSNYTRGELVDAVGVAPERVRVLPLGVRPDFLAIPRREPESVERILFFGRIIPSKGVFDLIEALGRLAKKGVDGWTLRAVGLGHHDRAREAAQEHGIGDRVEIADAVDDAGLVRELTAADLVALPSHFEAFGLAFAEAQAAGLPVVAYAAGSVPEVVQDGVTGWLGPVGDVGRLAENLERALTDLAATRAAGAAARRRVEECFTWQRTIEILEGGFDDVCGGSD